MPPTFDPSAARQVQKILYQRNNPSPKTKTSVQEELPNFPEGLQPIHLRSELLPQLAPHDVLFAVLNGARNIVKRRHQDLANPTQVFHDQPTRTQSVFIDDSGIESDGEGGDVPSRATTQTSSRPSAPARTNSIIHMTTIDLGVKVKPKESCKTCNRFFVGVKQLEVHKKSKKHIKQIRNIDTTHCRQSNQFLNRSTISLLTSVKMS